MHSNWLWAASCRTARSAPLPLPLPPSLLNEPASPCALCTTTRRTPWRISRAHARALLVPASFFCSPCRACRTLPPRLYVRPPPRGVWGPPPPGAPAVHQAPCPFVPARSWGGRSRNHEPRAALCDVPSRSLCPQWHWRAEGFTQQARLPVRAEKVVQELLGLATVPARKPFLYRRDTVLRYRIRPVPVVLRRIAFWPQLYVRFFAAG